MNNRKKELKKWFIDHPEVNHAMIAAAYGSCSTGMSALLYYHPTAPQRFIDACVSLGIPPRLLPPATMSKGQLQARVSQLEAENQYLREQIDGSL